MEDSCWNQIYLVSWRGHQRNWNQNSRSWFLCVLPVSWEIIPAPKPMYIIWSPWDNYAMRLGAAGCFTAAWACAVGSGCVCGGGGGGVVGWEGYKLHSDWPRFEFQLWCLLDFYQGWHLTSSIFSSVKWVCQYHLNQILVRILCQIILMRASIMLGNIRCSIKESFVGVPVLAQRHSVCEDSGSISGLYQ